MNFTLNCFIDSDVIISAVISQKGVAYWFLTQTDVKKFISNYSKIEVLKVAKRLKLNLRQTRAILNYCQVVEIDRSLNLIKTNWEKYVTDVDDAHIIAGAAKAKARFLISYNQKHFRTELIKRELDIISMRPAWFLQYLRSSINRQ